MSKHIKAKVLRVGNDWQVMVRDGNAIHRMKTLGDFMKWDRRYNSKEFVERKLKDNWGYTVVNSIM